MKSTSPSPTIFNVPPFTGVPVVELEGVLDGVLDDELQPAATSNTADAMAMLAR